MLSTEVLRRTVEIPAKFVEVTAQDVVINHLLLEDGVLREVSSGNVAGAGIRVLKNGWGFASTSSLSEKHISTAAQKALKAAANRRSRIEMAPVDPSEDEVEATARRDPLKISFEDRRELLYEAERVIKEYRSIVSYTVFIADSWTLNQYVNSEGARIRAKYPRTVFSVTVYGKKDGRIQGASERVGGVGGYELVDRFREVTDAACRKVLRLLDAEEAPRGRYRVVLDPRLGGVFIHEALGHAAEADHVLVGESILTGKLGEKIAPETVTIYDDPTLSSSYGFYFYDAEGLRAEKKPIMDKGTLVNFLNTRETAAAMGAQPTGNARSQGYDYPPLVRMSNTYLQPGDHSLEELIEDIKEGVYLKGSKGGEVDTARGVFQFNAEEGVLIENGELSRTVKDVSLSGSTLDILGRIDGVGDDFALHIGYCGKEAQSVPVGDGGPHIRTRALVGGKDLWTRKGL
jgi:TldD protein